MKHTLWFLIVCVPSVGCVDVASNDDDPPVRKADSVAPNEVMPADNAAATESSGTTERRDFSGLSFDVPADWEDVPLSAMQQGVLTARFTIPVGDETATLTLSRSGGSVDANLDRWRGQMSGDSGQTETINVAGITSTRIELSGRFSPGFGKPPISDARMIGIVIPMPPRHHFIKLTGPSDAVSALSDDLNRFAKSARKD